MDQESTPSGFLVQEVSVSGSVSVANVREILFAYGTDVLKSDEFQEAFYQPHHVVTNVAVHSINVAIVSIVICLLLAKIGIQTNMRDMVRAALCHDLGIMGREKKYKNNRECCMQHPVDSVEVAKKILGDYDDKTLGIIETHMWPVRPGRPKSIEGYVITVADKYAAVMERVHSDYHTRHIVLKPIPAAG